MLGHKIDDIRTIYYYNNTDTLKKEYLKGLKNFTLEEVKIVTTEQNDNLIQDLKEEKETIKLENRIEKLEKQIQTLKNVEQSNT